jgi:hypothetical protein
MLQFFMNGGPFMFILLFLFVLILVLSVKKVIDLFAAKETNPALLEKGVNAIIFWGAFSVVIGFLAHFLGIYEAMQAIARASDISPAIVSMGYSMSLITVLSGLFIFMVSALIWFFLRWRLKNIMIQS